MTFLRLVFRNIEGSSFRSWIIFLSAALMAGLVVAATLLINGARTSMHLANSRLGADIIVVPAGATQDMETAFLMGSPATLWMPKTVADQVKRTPGVTAVSPQLFLSTLVGATCCSVPEMFLVAYDPATDFTLRPWLQAHTAHGLDLGQAIGGSYVFLPDGSDNILVYGYEIDLKGNLEPTGSGLDQTMFFTFDTAHEISRLSPFRAERQMEIPPDSISSVMVRVQPGTDTSTVARQIKASLPNVDAVENSHLFAGQRERLDGLLNSVLALLAIVWVLAIILTALIFSILINQRRQEIGVLRALGASRRNVMQALLGEGLFLAMLGGMAGIGMAMLSISLFRAAIIDWMGMPFLTPSPLALAGLALEGLLMAVLTVIPAALLVAGHIVNQEPALVMRK